ncbi:nucleotide-binding oligomerization domain-containing protein 2 isoform X3 [Pristis pectinata]|uniref:nucleotide-binding oligomerization domain-containing protein 2 isoform X3 n=1 Tax=Pristis pectinata TaxID=685728 RepID=UPI00223E4F7A|nr:nucleotide-binding oligomerization domain-containing protein 2 isoform X3 [Pristis pectinata]
MTLLPMPAEEDFVTHFPLKSYLATLKNPNVRAASGMSADQLLQAQRYQFVTILGRSSVENFETILDHLLAWDLLNWEEYETVKLSRHLFSSSRNLLDVIICKGTRACELFIVVLKNIFHSSQLSGLLLMNYNPPEETDKSTATSLASQTLQKRRPDLVRKLHGRTAAVLALLHGCGHFSKYECDEIQLPIYTPSQQARKLLDLTKGKGDDAAHVLLEYIESEPGPIKLVLDNACIKYQEKLSSTLAAQSRFLTNYAGTENMCLEDVYVNCILEITNTTSESGCLRSLIGLEDIFGPDGVLNKDADVVLIIGEAGSGKSTSLQQMQQLWATKQAFQEFTFVFAFSCRRLNFIDTEVSLRMLLFEHCCWPDDHQDEVFQYILDHPEEIMFMLDGFDELKFQFTDEERHCSPTKPTTALNLIFNLLQGNLMKSTKKVMTSRPSAVTAMLRKYLQKEITLKGFSREGIEAFIKKCHSNTSNAEHILYFVEANSAVHGLCHVPFFCWIVSNCHEQLMQNSGDFTQTMTDIYLLILDHFLLHFTHNSQGVNEILQSQIATILHLSKLAMDGLISCNYVFSAAHLQEAQISKEDISLGFLVHSHSFSRAWTANKNKNYEFLHITIQCFFAALYITISDNVGESTLYSLFKSREKGTSSCMMSAACIESFPFSCLQSNVEPERRRKTMLQEAEKSNLQITANFVSGLLSGRHRNLIQKFSGIPKQSKKYKLVKNYLAKGIEKHFLSIPPAVGEEKKSMHALPEFVWWIKCIYEMQDNDLAKQAVSNLEVDHLKLTYCGIGPVECTALAYVLKHLKNPMGLQLDYNSVGDIGIEQLLPCLINCQSIYLRANNISDRGASKLVDQALGCCNLQKIALFHNNLTDASAQNFAKLLKHKKNFIALRLWGNKVGDAGASAIAAALENNTSLLWLSLVGNNIGSEGARALALMLKKNTILEELCLQENNLIDEDIEHFIEGLQNNSSLKVLKLSNNKITKKGMEFIVTALKHNTTITSIWLGRNQMTAMEIEEMTRAERRLTF